MPHRTPAAGEVSPLAKSLIFSWLSWTQLRALVRSSRSPTGPRPLRASSIRPGSWPATLVPSCANGTANAVISAAKRRKATRKTTSVASDRRVPWNSLRWIQPTTGARAIAKKAPTTSQVRISRISRTM